MVVVVSPAWIRTCWNVMRRKSRGRPMDVTEKLGLFAGSIGVVSIIGVAVSIAFYATCWAGFFVGAAASEVVPHRRQQYEEIAWGLFTGLGFGIIAAIVAAIFLLRWLWPRRDPHLKPPDDPVEPE